ncbi:MAG TPA: hypothetical protein VIY27_14735 [Myxococcota bacterium]
MRSGILIAAMLAVAVFAAGGCDRHTQPYVPGEEPEQPDLSKIFPEGASGGRAAMPGLPPSPQQRGAPPMMASPAPAQAQAPAEERAEPIRGTVRLAPALEGRIPAGGVLFIIARHGSGGPPLAVKRIPSPSVPFSFEIGPDDRMMATLPFTGPLQLSARLDADGNVSSGSGDLAGEPVADVEPGAKDVTLLLDRAL